MRRIIASCSVVLLSIVLLGACGGSSDKPASSNSEPSLTLPDGNGSSNEFSKLYEDSLKQKFKITFVDDSGDETTYAQDGNGKSMYSSGDSQYFISADETVTCNKSSGGEAECTKVGVGTSVNPFLGIYNAGKTFVTALARFGDNSSKTIAGRDADCVTFSKKTVEEAGPLGAALGSAIKGSLTYCVDKETGVLLEYSTKDADGKTTEQLQGDEVRGAHRLRLHAARDALVGLGSARLHGPEHLLPAGLHRPDDPRPRLVADLPETQAARRGELPRRSRGRRRAAPRASRRVGACPRRPPPACRRWRAPFASRTSSPGSRSAAHHRLRRTSGNPARGE